jgi:hypothetical protein
MKEIIRRVRFKPYRKGQGPIFTLTVWDTGQRWRDTAKWLLGYRLTMKEMVPASTLASLADQKAIRTILFEGEDFGCSPMHAIDSDEAVEGIMAFLTIRPGDTDSEYFEGYTQEQLDYCSQHAEALASEVEHRFSKENR